eukprot:1545272-Amphidinium_carterae.1
MNHSGARAPEEKVPLVSTAIMPSRMKRNVQHIEEIEPIGDLFWCEDSGDQLKVGMEPVIRKMSDLGVPVPVPVT